MSQFSQAAFTIKKYEHLSVRLIVHSTFTLSAHCPINYMTPYVEIKQVILSSEETALSNGKCDLGSNSRRSCVSEISPFHVETKLFTFFGINRLCRRKDYRPEVHLTANLWSSVHENQEPSILRTEFAGSQQLQRILSVLFRSSTVTV